MKAEQREQFLREGFLIVPEVLTSEQVASLRTELAKLFSMPATELGDFDRRGRLGSVRFDVCARHPSLRWLLTHPPLLEALRGLLGDDFVFLPEMSAHHAGYGDWHKDTTSQERAGEAFHWSEDYLMVEAGFYLQPNSVEHGGGLSVQPGSHRKPDRYIDIIDRNVFDKVRTKLKAWNVIPTEKGYPIPSKAGDLVFFDFRIDHRATPAAQNPVPPEYQKYARFFACSRANHHVTKYIEYIKRRPDYLYLKDPYPAAVTELTTQQGLNLPR